MFSPPSLAPGACWCPSLATLHTLSGRCKPAATVGRARATGGRLPTYAGAADDGGDAANGCRVSPPPVPDGGQRCHTRLLRQTIDSLSLALCAMRLPVAATAPPPPRQWRVIHLSPSHSWLPSPCPLRSGGRHVGAGVGGWPPAGGGWPFRRPPTLSTGGGWPPYTPPPIFSHPPLFPSPPPQRPSHLPDHRGPPQAVGRSRRRRRGRLWRRRPSLLAW